MSSQFHTSALAGAALAGLLFTGGAGAQTAPEPKQDTPHEVIFVYAPYVVTRQVINPMMSRKSSTGIELVSASRTVNFADLNLSEAPDVATLKMRVRLAAQDACSDIERHYPKTKYHPIPENQDCVGNAVEEAMVTVRAVEAAAAKY